MESTDLVGFPRGAEAPLRHRITFRRSRVFALGGPVAPPRCSHDRKKKRVCQTADNKSGPHGLARSEL